VSFNDGDVRDVDLTPTLDDDRFSQLRDPTVFANARIGQLTGAIEWTDEIGLDPDVIYAALDLGPGAPRIRPVTIPA
jgi:hypothetical protein